LRVTTPYAGSGKGFHVLPEIGEEVIVGFENGNAEKPFVLGAMFHGTGKSGHGGAGNYIKGIETATGIKIKFDDSQKSLLLEDPSGNTVFMDGNKNVTVTAIDTLNLIAKNVNIIAGNDITVSATNNQTNTVGKLNKISIGGNHIVNVTGNVEETILGDLNSHTEKGRMITTQKGLETVSNGSILKHAQKEVKGNSAEKAEGH
jgi:type VI secretion system secreted protein VgrG